MPTAHDAAPAHLACGALFLTRPSCVSASARIHGSVFDLTESRTPSPAAHETLRFYVLADSVLTREAVMKRAPIGLVTLTAISSCGPASGVRRHDIYDAQAAVRDQLGDPAAKWQAGTSSVATAVSSTMSSSRSWERSASRQHPSIA